MFKVGGSVSHSDSKSTTNSSSTTTPIVPEWASSLTQGVAGRVGSLMQLDPQSLVAPANALQSRAAVNAANLNGSPWNYENAANETARDVNTSWLDPYLSLDTPFASGGKAYDWVGRYMNPYMSEVVDATGADLDANAGQVRAQQALDLAGSGAFGGSGAALTQSMTEGELARARASALSGLRSQGYNTALQAAAGDADRATQARIANAQMALQDRAQKVGWQASAADQRLRAANQLAGISSEYDANQRANLQAQAAVGDTLRGIDQQERQAPMVNAQQIVAMLSGLPINLFTGQQTNGTETTKGSKTEVGAYAEASSKP